VERDLLIRKLFTAGLDATTVNASAFSSFSAMLMSIWSASRKAPSVEPVAALLMTSDKLPAQSLVVLAQPAAQRLANLAAERSIAA
jgi:cellulose synthase (UDP-forming)